MTCAGGTRGLAGWFTGVMQVVDVYRLSRRLKELADAAVPAEGDGRLNPGELEVMNYLANNPGESVSGIARETRLSKSLVSRYVRELHGVGLVQYQADCFDARYKMIELSESARKEIQLRAEVSVQFALYDHEPWLSYKQQRDALDLMRSLADILR